MIEIKKEVKLNYGALADPLETQLNQQGLTLGKEQDLIYKLWHSLTMCRFHLLTDSQYTSCLNKLHKKVMSFVQPLED